MLQTLGQSLTQLHYVVERKLTLNREYRRLSVHGGASAGSVAIVTPERGRDCSRDPARWRPQCRMDVDVSIIS